MRRSGGSVAKTRRGLYRISLKIVSKFGFYNTKYNVVADGYDNAIDKLEKAGYKAEDVTNIQHEAIIE